MYYVTRVQVQHTDPNSGRVKKITEQYLVDALSVTDAEAIVNAEFDNQNMDFEVKSVTASRIISVLSA